MKTPKENSGTSGNINHEKRGAAPKPRFRPGVISQAAIGILGTLRPARESKAAQLLRRMEGAEPPLPSFIHTGLYLGQVRDLGLFRKEFPTFEEYTRAKWSYGRHYVNRLIAAAQVGRNLINISSRNPECESQIRPLIGLTQTQARQAWLKAVEKAAGSPVTAQMVEAAVRELGFHVASDWTSIDDRFIRLLILLRQKASNDTILAEVEALQETVRGVLKAKQRKIA